MSVDFQAKSGWSFNANVSGIALLGLVHELAGATLSTGFEALGPRPPFVAKAVICRDNAVRIDRLTDA